MPVISLRTLKLPVLLRAVSTTLLPTTIFALLIASPYPPLHCYSGHLSYPYLIEIPSASSAPTTSRAVSRIR